MNEKKTGNNSTRKIPPNVHIFRLSMVFLVTAALLFIAAMVLGARYIPAFTRNLAVSSPAGLTIAHLLLPGWATMLAMGASFQLIQVILLTRLFSRVLGYVHFIFYTSGLVTLAVSFYMENFRMVVAGGCMITIGVVLYVINMVVTMIRSKKWNVFVMGIGIALLNLMSTVALGTFVGWSIWKGWAPHLYNQLFYSHLWLGLAGWIGGLIITFSFKLLPMFLTSAKRMGIETYVIILSLQLGVWFKVASFWMHPIFFQTISLLCIVVMAIGFNRLVWTVWRQSRVARKGTVAVAAGLIPFTSLFLCVWLINVAIFPHSPFVLKWTIAFVFFLIAGWVSGTILGYMPRIIPFLWWAYRFHTKWNKKSKVLLSEMVPENRMRMELMVYIAAVTTTSLSFVYSSPVFAAIGQMTAVFILFLYIFELVKVIRF